MHKKLGLQPGWGGATRLTRLVGPQTALFWIKILKDIFFCFDSFLKKIVKIFICRTDPAVYNGLIFEFDFNICDI